MQNQEAVPFFDKLSDGWDDHYREYVLYRDRNSVLTEWLQSKLLGSTVTNIKALDVGCGTGPAIASYKNVGILPVGADISIKMLQKAKEKGYCDVYHINDSRIPLPSDSINLSHMFNVIEFVRGPEVLLSEVLRVLSKDGCFLINVCNFKSFLEKAARFKHFLLRRGPFPKHPMLVREYKLGEMISLLEEVGFRDVRLFKFGICNRIKSKDGSWLQKFTRNRLLGQMIYIECRK